MMTTGSVNPRMTLEATGLGRRRSRPLQPDRAGAGAGRRRARRGRARPGRRAAGHHRQAHRPQPQGQVRRPRARASKPQIWWENNAPLSPEHFERLHADMRAHVAGRRAVRPGPLRRRRSGAPAERAGDHRTRLARPVHPPPAAPPRPRRAGGFRPRLHHPQLPELQGRPGAARRALRDGDRDLVRAEAGADRRHRLRRREQEVGLHHPQLPAAREGRDADALLGQPRRGRSRGRGGVLRPVRHRQDHAVGRSGARADRRRRARLVRRRHVQLRRRLLRQDHQPLARGRAGDLHDHLDVRHRRREHGLRSRHATRSTSTTTA